MFKSPYKSKPKTPVLQIPSMQLQPLSNKSHHLLKNSVMKMQRKKENVNKSSMLVNSESNQGIKSLENNLYSWVTNLNKVGFTVTHEMTIAVRSVDNIGYLVDKILSKKGITLQNFEWKAE